MQPCCHAKISDGKSRENQSTGVPGAHGTHCRRAASTSQCCNCSSVQVREECMLQLLLLGFHCMIISPFPLVSFLFRSLSISPSLLAIFCISKSSFDSSLTLSEHSLPSLSLLSKHVRLLGYLCYLHVGSLTQPARQPTLINTSLCIQLRIYSSIPDHMLWQGLWFRKWT